MPAASPERGGAPPPASRWWRTTGRPVLEAAALLAATTGPTDDARLAEVADQGVDEVRVALVRLEGRGLVTCSPVRAWRAGPPARLVDVAPTGAGLRALAA